MLYGSILIQIKKCEDLYNVYLLYFYYDYQFEYIISLKLTINLWLYYQILK